MLLGYARVSTTEQETSAQEDALVEEGVERTYYVEQASGDRWDRPEWADVSYAPFGCVNRARPDPDPPSAHLGVVQTY